MYAFKVLAIKNIIMINILIVLLNAKNLNNVNKHFTFNLIYFVHMKNLTLNIQKIRTKMINYNFYKKIFL